MIHLHDKIFELYIDAEELDRCIDLVSAQINLDYYSKSPVFIAVLNGSFMFASDLLKKINMPCEICFTKLSSYEGTRSTGEVKELIGLPENLEGKDLIIVEDIVDTGNTLSVLYQQLEKTKANSIKIATLLYKPNAYNGSIQLDYVGKEIPNDFVVGYGLDYNELGRNLSEIYKLKLD